MFLREARGILDRGQGTLESGSAALVPDHAVPR